MQGAEQRLLCCSGSLWNTVLRADFLQCGHRGSKGGGDSGPPGLLSLVSLDALVLSGSQASSRSCLLPLLSLSWVLSFGLGGSRSCSGDAGRPWYWNMCPVGCLLLLHMNVAPHYPSHAGMCGLQTHGMSQGSVFHPGGHKQLLYHKGHLSYARQLDGWTQ